MKIFRKLNQEILIIAVFTLLITLLWMYLGVNRALEETEKPVVSQAEIRPLDPNLDKDVFEELRNRK